MSALHPVIGLPSCVRSIEHRPFHGVGERYVNVVASTMQAVPVLIPAIGVRYDMSIILDHIDGLLITGSQSNVEPKHYGCEPEDPHDLFDPERDATTFPLIRAAIERGIPLLCICRGIQELNVALGGTLYQKVHLAPGKLDHRDKGCHVAPEIRFALAHSVTLTPDGYLASISPEGEEFMVNSLHTQAIRKLAPTLEVEAVSEDGVIEAVRVSGAKNFAIGIQWHPEWRVPEHPFSEALFNRFGEAARLYAATRQRHNAVQSS